MQNGLFLILLYFDKIPMITPILVNTCHINKFRGNMTREPINKHLLLVSPHL